MKSSHSTLRSPGPGGQVIPISDADERASSVSAGGPEAGFRAAKSLSAASCSQLFCKSNAGVGKPSAGVKLERGVRTMRNHAITYTDGINTDVLPLTFGIRF